MSNHSLSNLTVIAGPTASGKSSIAIEIAKKSGAVIVNADSRQVYRELKIGSSQPVPDTISEGNVWIIDGVKHFLYGHKSINEVYTVVDYKDEVDNLLKQLGGIPILLVGGTGLFIESVIYNYKFTSADSSKLNPFSREYLENLSVTDLQLLLTSETLDVMNESDKANKYRLIRAIERGGIPKAVKRPFKQYFVLDPGREAVIQNIERRTESLFTMGLLDEVQQLWNQYHPFTLNALKSIGYSEFIPYFNGECTLQEVTEQINLHTRQFAKRQRTWWRRNSDIKCFDQAEQLKEAILSSEI